jgi:hypothetical protein
MRQLVGSRFGRLQLGTNVGALICTWPIGLIILKPMCLFMGNVLQGFSCGYLASKDLCPK